MISAYIFKCDLCKKTFIKIPLTKKIISTNTKIFCSRCCLRLEVRSKRFELINMKSIRN